MTTAQWKELDTSLPEFSAKMRNAIDNATDRKGDFTQYDLGEFIDAFTEDVNELKEELDGTEEIPSPRCETCGNVEWHTEVRYDRVMNKAIDVANLAYMIWWASRKEYFN